MNTNLVGILSNFHFFSVLLPCNSLNVKSSFINSNNEKKNTPVQV